MSEERFRFVLNEAKDLYLDKLQAEEKLRSEKANLLGDIEMLRSENERLQLENKRLVENAKSQAESLERAKEELEKVTEKQKNSKMFFKMYFKDLLNRMKETERNGVYNAETFSYLIGEVGRSLYSTTLNETNSPPKNKMPSQGKLSLNKENRRARYEDVEPSTSFKNPSKTSSKGCKQTTINIKKWQDISNNAKENEQLPNENKQTLDATTNIVPNEGNLKSNTAATVDGQMTSNESQSYVDPELTLYSPIGPPCKSSTQIDLDKESVENTASTLIPADGRLQNPGEISSTEDNQFLDPNLPWPSPIGPPSTSSTPQGPHSGDEPKRFTLAFSPRQHSPSLLAVDDSETIRCTLLPEIISLGDEVPEQTQPKSPTILTRSHSLTKSTLVVPSSPEHRTPKRKRSDERSKQADDGSRKVDPKPAVESHTVSPDIIVLDDFVKPSSTDVPRKRPKTSYADESPLNRSSLLFASPKTFKTPSSSTIHQRNYESNILESNETIDKDEPKIALNFSLDESTIEEKVSLGKDDDCPKYKYKEVVRGKDKRAKLNGYFCADCEKYYGGLKLSEAEMQERLKACSKHRAQFSPPPSTPEHFWEVDFMNTNEYIEKGFMRTESELPPEKRKLKSRRLKSAKTKK